MDKIKIDHLVTNEKIQFINKDRTFFEGIIKTVHNQYFAIRVSTEQPNCRLLQEKDQVEFLLIYDEEAFRCSATVLGCKVADSFQMILLDVPQILHKIERRKYARLQTVMEVEYCFLPKETQYNNLKEISSRQHRQMKKTFTVDISAGGMQVITYDNEEDQKQVLLSFFLKEEIRILCTVIRATYDEKNKNYRTALQYKDIDEKHRALIAEFVNERVKTK